MKYILVALLHSAIFFGQNKFVIEGKLKNDSIAMVYLQILDGWQKETMGYYKVDSTVVSNNSFRFQGILTHPCEKAVLYTKYSNKVLVALDAGLNPIHIDATAKNNLSLNTAEPQSASNSIQIKMDSLNNSYYVKYGADTEVEYNNGTKGVRKILSSEKIAELDNAFIEVLKKYKNSYYTLYNLYALTGKSVFRKNPGPLLEVYSQLTPDIRNSNLGTTFLNLCQSYISLQEKTGIGKKVPVFTVRTNENKMFSNADLIGKPYVIAFSATWCKPCLAFQPVLKELYNRYKKQRLEVVYFNLNDDDKIWKQHIATKGLNWINVSEGVKMNKSKITKQFAVDAIPVYLVVDKSGNIIYNSDKPYDEQFSRLEAAVKTSLK